MKQFTLGDILKGLTLLIVSVSLLVGLFTVQETIADYLNKANRGIAYARK